MPAIVAKFVAADAMNRHLPLGVFTAITIVTSVRL